jgi:hypothetical protein
MYQKMPWEKIGHITNVTQRLKKNTKKFKPRTCQNGCIAFNVPASVKNMIINNIKHLNHLDVCRIDIITQNLDSLTNGNYKIIEVNGRCGMNLQYFYSSKNFIQRSIISIQHLLIRLFIGLSNILSGKGANLIDLITKMPGKVYIALLEKESQYLFSQDYYQQ